MPTLLIVDDEIDIREFAANFFRRRKIDVLTAASGEEALAVMERILPNLILLDISLPGIDGVETLQRIRQKNLDAKVVMVTGQKPEDQDAFDRCRQLGAFDYIHKPLVMEELEKIVLKEIT